MQLFLDTYKYLIYKLKHINHFILTLFYKIELFLSTININSFKLCHTIIVKNIYFLCLNKFIKFTVIKSN